MKKIFILLGVTLISLAACTRFEKETIPSGLNAVVAAPSIEIVADDTLDPDYEFLVKVTPGAGNNYYSFAIVKGSISNADAESILTQGYKKNCISVKLEIKEVETDVPLCGNFKASEQADTTLHAFSLVPNTKYTVYAVGNNEKGTVSDIASLEITTSDNTEPVPYTVSSSGTMKWGIDDSGIEDGTVVIKFDDPIEFTDALKAGTAKFYATYQAANDTYFDGEDYCFNDIFTSPIPLDSLKASGNTVSIQVPERIPGSAVLISFDAGVVKNGVGLENPAIEYGGYYYNNETPTPYGLATRFKTASWKFARPMIPDENTGDLVRMPGDTVLYFQNIADIALEAVAQKLVEPKWEGNEYNYVAAYKAPTIIYTNSKLRQVSYPAEENDYGAPLQDSLFVACLSEVPDLGSSVALYIPAESVEDLWGNPCQEFSTFFVDEDKNEYYGNYFFSCGYSIADFTGTYSYVGQDSDGVDHEEAAVVIAPDPESADGILIYDLFKNMPDLLAWFGGADSWVPRAAPLSAKANIHDGSISIGNNSVVDAVLSIYSWTGTFDITNVIMSLDAVGTINAEWEWNMTGMGNWSLEQGVLTRISEDYEIPASSAVAAAPAKKVSLKAKKKAIKSFVSVKEKFLK